MKMFSQDARMSDASTDTRTKHLDTVVTTPAELTLQEWHCS
jgi:hypothetical protein